MGKSYAIFGAGPAGLYTAWRLVNSGDLDAGDTIELIEWGDYAFAGTAGTRRPAGRICSHHYQGEVANSYVEIGGMRYIEWDAAKKEGHQLVTKVISMLGLDDEVVAFFTTDDPLYYLRGWTFYQSQLGAGFVAPYNTPGNNERPSTQLVANIAALMTEGNDVDTRAQQCEYYAAGALSAKVSSVVYNGGDVASNIGYWNFFYDQAGNEGYQYATDAGGYSANTINWNAANAAVYTGEFAPGGAFKTLKTGYSRVFEELYAKTKAAASAARIGFTLTSNTRLHSIWMDDGAVTYRTAGAATPFKAAGEPQTSDCAFLAMPRHCVELVARATRYADMTGKHDFLNDTRVLNYLESVIEQPSYKVAMFFDKAWWEETKYPPRLINDGVSENVFGPTITDLPLRQVYYFGNNAPDPCGPPVYSLLASYDDMRFTRFWQELELTVAERRETPLSQNYQALIGGGTATAAMVQMLRLELAKVHYGNPDEAWSIPKPLETVFMDWSLDPFGAGYHAWAAHYDIGDVMQRIRAPVALAGGDGPVYIVGSTYSNDQAWVEGAFCTAESVLTEFLHLDSIADPCIDYPLICGRC